ncbi:MAG TPA: hypothetical protein VM733_08890 [Thermoanaerobaculia bacterium]|nr:hypothetical protein [Thermoanaerobaculia bacterium]
MLRHRPDLIVPIRDRRARKRYLTLKNFGKVMILLTAGFVAITIRSEMRGRTTGQFGRLFQSEIPAVEQKPLEVVHEAPPAATVADTAPTIAQPFVIEPVDAPPIATTVAPVEPIRSSVSEVSIVGGPDGVNVVRKDERPKPVLSGGFGRR